MLMYYVNVLQIASGISAPTLRGRRKNASGAGTTIGIRTTLTTVISLVMMMIVTPTIHRPPTRSLEAAGPHGRRGAPPGELAEATPSQNRCCRQRGCAGARLGYGQRAEMSLRRAEARRAAALLLRAALQMPRTGQQPGVQTSGAKPTSVHSPAPYYQSE